VTAEILSFQRHLPCPSLVSSHSYSCTLHIFCHPHVPNPITLSLYTLDSTPGSWFRVATAVGASATQQQSERSSAPLSVTSEGAKASLPFYFPTVFTPTITSIIDLIMILLMILQLLLMLSYYYPYYDPYYYLTIILLLSLLLLLL
jgi:hypothetical protein